MIPTATTCLHESAIEAHSDMESPLTTLVPSLELKENQAGIFMFSSSSSSAYACYSHGIESLSERITGSLEHILITFMQKSNILQNQNLKSPNLSLCTLIHAFFTKQAQDIG